LEAGLGVSLLELKMAQFTSWVKKEIGCLGAVAGFEGFGSLLVSVAFWGFLVLSGAF